MDGTCEEWELPQEVMVRNAGEGVCVGRRVRVTESICKVRAELCAGCDGASVLAGNEDMVYRGAREATERATRRVVSAISDGQGTQDSVSIPRQ